MDSSNNKDENTIIFDKEIVIGGIKLCKILKYKGTNISRDIYFSYSDNINIKNYASSSIELNNIKEEVMIDNKNSSIDDISSDLYIISDNNYRYINTDYKSDIPIGTNKIYRYIDKKYILVENDSCRYKKITLFSSTLFNYIFIEINNNKLFNFREPYNKYKYTFYNNDNLLIVTDKNFIYNYNIHEYYKSLTINNETYYIHRIIEFLNNSKLKKIIKENLNVKDRTSNRNIMYRYIYLKEDELPKLNIIKIDKLYIYGYKGFIVKDKLYEYKFDNLYFSLKLSKFLRKHSDTKFKFLYEKYSDIVNDKYIITNDINNSYHKIYYNTLYKNLNILNTYNVNNVDNIIRNNSVIKNSDIRRKFNLDKFVSNINLLNESHTCYEITKLNIETVKEIHYDNLSLEDILKDLSKEEKEELEELNYIENSDSIDFFN